MRSLVIACLLCGVASAKPAWRPQPPKQVDPSELAARFAEAIRKRDAAGVQEMLADPLTFDGLWFADAACAKRFGTKGTLEKGDLRTLARCFTQQKLIATTRKTVMANVAVLTLSPGVELELLFKGDRVIYAGGVWPRDTDRGQPTLTAQAFEALRTAGTTQLDAALAGKLQGSTASAWIKICLDKTGTIASTYLAEAKPATAGPLFVAAIADWKFKPWRGAACAMTLLSYPAASAPATEVLPPTPSVSWEHTVTITDETVDIMDVSGVPIGSAPQNVAPSLLEQNRIRGSKKIDPDARTKSEIAKAGKPGVLASFKLCVDTAGRGHQCHAAAVERLSRLRCEARARDAALGVPSVSGAWRRGGGLHRGHVQLPREAVAAAQSFEITGVPSAPTLPVNVVVVGLPVQPTSPVAVAVNVLPSLS